jgi:hypothetical protein
VVQNGPVERQGLEARLVLLLLLLCCACLLLQLLAEALQAVVSDEVEGLRLQGGPRSLGAGHAAGRLKEVRAAGATNQRQLAINF